jgi:hypothetical protein
MQFTNAWNQPATIQSVEVVDPAKSYKASGKSQVLSTVLVAVDAGQSQLLFQNRWRRERCDVFRCDLCGQQRGAMHDRAAGSRGSAGE